MRRSLYAGLILAVLVAAGACGEDEDAGSTSSSTSVEAAGEGGVTTTVDEGSCQVEGRTIATAAEAHRAATGVYPSSMEELVGEWLQTAPVFDWQYDAAGESFSLTGPCDVDLQTTTTVGGDGP